jgi:hypothetical protein
MRGKQPKKDRRAKEGSCVPNQGKWHEMNRKQRREVMRKIQSGEISLEVVHPHAAGIDIGNESHYVAVPPGRDSQPVRRFGQLSRKLCLTTCRSRPGIQQSRAGWVGNLKKVLN